MEEKPVGPPAAKSPEDLIPEPEGIITAKRPPFYKNKFFLGFVGISLLVAFLLGGVMIGKMGTQKSITPPPAGPDFYKGSPTPTPHSTTEATIEPINASQFKKMETVEECDNPIGVIGYYTSDYEFLKINPSSDKLDETSKNGLSKINNFLSQNNLTSNQDISAFEAPFHNYCGGASFIYIKELAGIKYPGADVTRSMLVYTTQSAFGGTSVVVYAKKGNQFIQLSKILDDDSLYQDDIKACNGDKQNPTQAEETCYQNKLVNDAGLESAAISEAKKMVSTFKLSL